MKNVPAEKDLKKFKITLLLLPIIPCAILFYKQHYTISWIILGFCWGMLFFMLSVSLLGKNIDKFVYVFVHKILSFIGIILSSFALIFVWICTIFPTGIIAKLVKRDRLILDKKQNNSYWKDVQDKEPTYENQY